MKLILFLRKVKIFNKSRYSRNRQNTRVAFYFSLIVNILVIFAVFSLYYKILFKLSTLWWFFFVFMLSFILSSFLKTLAITTIKSILLFFETLLNINPLIKEIYIVQLIISKLKYLISLCSKLLEE